MLVRAKFETKTIPKSPKLTGLFLCSNCVYHKAGYIIPCSSFSFKLTNGKTITWTYKNYFSCDSKDVIYILICKTCDNFYLGQTQDFKQRTAKHKSDLKTRITAFAGYAQNTLETVTKLNGIFKYSHAQNTLETASKLNRISKYFHSVIKQIQRLENIKENDIFSDGNLH